MARATKLSKSPDIYGAIPPPPSRRPHNGTQDSLSPSPPTSISSDKENRASRPLDKGKGRAVMGEVMGPPGARSASKRALDIPEPQQQRERSQRRRTTEMGDAPDLDYDPDQDIEERRKLRKGLRDLSKTVLDNRVEYLAPASTGLRDTLLKQNSYIGQVKQTSDATIDSRLLVTVADYSYKKTVALTSGDTAQGVDLEDFLSKLKQYLREGTDGDGRAPPPGTQRRRRLQDDDDDDNDGEVLDWAFLGRSACVKHISRPAVPGFLLGPLSLEKRARKAVVRRAAFKPNNIVETRPEVLGHGDIEKAEEAQLSVLCERIKDKLSAVIEETREVVISQYHDDMSQEEKTELLDRYNFSEDGGFAFFKFVVNPRSFGQTVENMFYVSFLVRDGKAGIELDERGLPFLMKMEPGVDAGGEKIDSREKHQSIIALDMTMWKGLVKAFDIRESMIPHRRDNAQRITGSKGWYN